MKILHLNTADYGGAAKAAYRLHIGLKQFGHESKFMVKVKTGALENILCYQTNSKFKKLKNRIKDHSNYAFFKKTNPDPKYAFHQFDERYSHVVVGDLLAQSEFQPEVPGHLRLSPPPVPD